MTIFGSLAPVPRVLHAALMRRPVAEDSLPLVVRPAAAPSAIVPHIPARWLFVATMSIATAAALCAGLTLGFVTATDTAFQSRWTEAVQAHGRLQLGAWATPIVAALAFEFLPRLNSRPWLPVAPRIGAIALLFLGAGAQALGLLTRTGWLMTAGTSASLAGAVAFAVLVLYLRPRPLRFSDAHPLFMPAAAAWLVIASGAALLSELRTAAQIVPLSDSRLVIELTIRGFFLHAIIGIGLRAFPGHLDLPLVPPRLQAAVLLGLSVSVACWAAGSGAVGLPDSEGLRRIGDLGLAGVIAAITLAMRLLSPPASLGSVPRYRLLIPLAWSGLVAYGLVLAVNAFLTDSAGFSIYEQGAIRHVFLLAFLAPFVFAMAHIVLARFGTGSVPSEGLLSAAVVLVVIAWPFRVLPLLWAEAPDGVGRASMAVAGSLALLGFAFALAVFVRATLQLTITPRHAPPRPPSRSPQSS